VILNRIELLQYLTNQSRPGAGEQVLAFLQVELRRADGLTGPAPGPLELGLARGRACRGLAAVVALEPGPWEGEVASLGVLLPAEGLQGRAWRPCLREGGRGWRQQRGQLELPWADDQGANAGNTIDGGFHLSISIIPTGAAGVLAVHLSCAKVPVDRKLPVQKWATFC
jgi:hypothetical protein